MERTKLVFCAFLLSCVGLALLAVAAHLSEPLHLRIPQIGDSYLGRFVSVEGTVTSSYTRNGHLFAKICATSCVRVVIFKSELQRLSTHENNIYLLHKGDRLRVSGKLSKYKGEYEVTADDAKVGS